MTVDIGTLLLPFDVTRRRSLVASGGPWHSLAASLAADLLPLHEREAPIPSIKARLTRVGGRCARDGVLLDFDPWSPDAHRCPQCGTVYSRPEDHEWWAMGAQLWSVERAVHASALYLLGNKDAHLGIAARILARITDQYLRWPNRDNVLGPSRPFFSTYLESIWLLNLCHAVSLLEAANVEGPTRTLTSRVRDEVIEPSLALISQYHEGLSNRQVWNEVAILSAMLTLGHQDDFDARVHSAGGLNRLIAQGLLPDGTWYEGENYHQFAHRGLWYGVQLLAATGHSLDAALADRFAAGFVTPFLGMLPDETFPSRRDSQYRVSIRQWRFAEWCELGLSYRNDERLADVRRRLYDGSVPAGDTGRSRSTADAERNVSPTALSRADCSWRALLMANDTSLDTDKRQADTTPGSVVLESQGLAVIRRDNGRTYIALEGGHGGGGHGHPDRLGLTLQSGDVRYLEDPGTGSYVEPTLHWYRSTLAHYAPLVDRTSQRRGEATLLAYEDRGGVGWIVKRSHIAPDVVATRFVVVCDGYLVDVLDWQASGVHEITLPLCGPADVSGEEFEWESESPPDAEGLEDGFRFASDIESTKLASSSPLHFAGDGQVSGAHGAAQLFVQLQLPAVDAVASSTAGTNPQLVRATVPAPPGRGQTRRHWLRTTGRSGRFVSCWNWSMQDLARVTRFEVLPPQAGIVRIGTADGTVADHSFVDNQWIIALTADGARSSIELESWRDTGNDASSSTGSQPAGSAGIPSRDSSRDATAAPTRNRRIDLASGAPHQWLLGERHYLRTDETWEEAGEPTALVELRADSQSLRITIDAHTGPLVVPPPGEENRLDNERADVNGDGVQLYFSGVDLDSWAVGWLIVPASPVRVTPLVVGQAAGPDVAWEATASGWRMTISIARSALPISNDSVVFDAIVNERPAHRERRRGQLVLSGGGGFAYLRGDRHDSAGALMLRLA